MEREHGKMETGPPKITEGLFSFLIPPPVREEISGDLCERYRSNGQYAKEVIEMLPYVVANQIRRNTSFPLFGIQAFLIFFCLGGFVAATDAAALDVPRWLRAVPPAALALVALLLRDAYRGTQLRPVWSAVLDLAIVVLVVLLLQFLLAVLSAASVLNPDWVLSPRRAFVAGAGLPMLFCLRLVGLSRFSELGEKISESDLARDYGRFQRRVRWRNRAIAFGGVLGILAALGYVASAASMASVVGWSLTIAGGALVIGYVFFKTSVRALPADAPFSSALALYRAELQRQAAILQKVWWWYLLSIVPALIGGMVASGMGGTPISLDALSPSQLLGFVVICILVGWLYVQHARSFHAKDEELSAVRQLQPN